MFVPKLVSIVGGNRWGEGGKESGKLRGTVGVTGKTDGHLGDAEEGEASPRGDTRGKVQGQELTGQGRGCGGGWSAGLAGSF
jgi:hypothetical protein